MTRAGDVLSERDGSGFSRLIRRMLEEGVLDFLIERRYQHRLSVAREPLYYLAIVAVKQTDVPLGWVEVDAPRTGSAERTTSGGRNDAR